MTGTSTDMGAWTIRNWALTLLAAVGILAGGVWAWRHVPVDAIPDLSDNQVIVWADWPGKSAEDIDEQVTRRLARGLQGLPGVTTVRGLSLTGSGYVYVIFEDRRDLYDCRTRTLERLGQLQADLPDGVAARLGPDATAMGQVFAFTLQGPADVERKRSLIDQMVVPALQGVPGVAEAAPAGGVVREYQIDVDPVRLEEQGITLDMLMMAVKAAGRDVGAMSVERSGVETMIRGTGFLRSADDVGRIVIRGNMQQSAGLLLRDIAEVRIGGAPRQGLLADQHGEQAGVIVAMRVGEDPSAVIRAVKERLLALRPTLAADDLVAVPFYDRAQLITETDATLTHVLIEELIVTVLVVTGFLLSFRASLAVALALPIGVAATFLVMHLLGVGANAMSLAGIAIAIGVMVDFSIVVVENVAQHLVRLRQRRPEARSPFDPEVVQAVIDGTGEVSRALLTAGATTVISFLPLFLLDDQAGRLFTPLATTKTIAIAAAVAIGLLIVPVFCRLMLPLRPLRSVEENPVSRGIAVAYDWALTHLLRRKVFFTACLLTFALSGWLIGIGWQSLSRPLRTVVPAIGETRIDQWLVRAFPGIGSSFLPPLDEGSLLFMPSVPATAGLGETQRVMHEQNVRIAEVPEVAGLMGKLGRAESALDPAPIGMIETVVALKPYAEWPVDDETGRRRTLAEVRAELSAVTDIPGVAPSWLQPIETRVVMLSTGIRSLLALQVVGDDPAALEAFAEHAEKVIQRVPGAADVQMQREGGKPYAEIRLDPERMARFGIDGARVADAIESALGGMPLALTVEGTKRYGVRIRYQRERRDDADELGQVQVAVAAGHGAIPLLDLVARPVIHTLRFTKMTPAAWRARQPLSVARNFTPLDATTAELTLPAGEEPAEDAAFTIVSSRPSNDAATSVIGPMAIRSEGGKRIQYVLLNARDRAEVDLVRDADARLKAAVAAGEIRLPAGTTWRWVGRFEQKLKADATMTWVIGLAIGAMIVLILVGTRSLLVTAIILGANLTVTTAGGFFAVHLWGAEMTTAVIVGFLVLLGVMFNDGILLGTYLHDLFRIPPTTVEEVHRRVFEAGLRRRRPAIMTNCTTLLALVPVLWSDGRGAELMRPMVLPVIGGMIADYLSLFSVPVFYAWWWERRLKR